MKFGLKLGCDIKVYFSESPFVLIHVLHKILSDKKRMLAADVEAIVRCMSKMYASVWNTKYAIS